MQRRRSVAAAVMVALLFAVGGTGCGDESGEAEGDGGAPTTAAPNGETIVVDTLDNSFQPETVTVEAGTEVIWENRGRNEHNVIPEDEDPDWTFEADQLQPGESVSHVFGEPGTYRYYCSIHGNVDIGMPGVVVVE